MSSSGSPPQPGVIPECGLWAGGQGITIRYSQLGDSGQGIAKKWRSDNERVANQSGFAHIKLGEASGFAGPYGAGLIISCPKGSDSAAILTVDVEYTKRASTPDSREEFAQLAVETLRVSAKDIVKCRGAENIPDGPPQIS
ncbi:hypothetical protein [Streptomyces sp. NPDC005408]|uniref:hypothetical protein n=1 Tax=Streptomyces sp. NPDC005408 TaxID=3155341 RepID=UPI0033B1A2ED